MEREVLVERVRRGDGDCLKSAAKVGAWDMNHGSRRRELAISDELSFSSLHTRLNSWSFYCSPFFLLCCFSPFRQ